MRTTTTPLFRFILSVCAALPFIQAAPAQTLAQKKDLLKKVLDASARMPDAQRKLFSAGARNYFQLAAQLNASQTKPGVGDTDGGLLGDRARTDQAKAALHAPVELAAGPGGVPRVSDPALDFLTSVVEGFTQSETSTAWCGNSVVVGYNDSGAFLRTAAVNPAAASSFNGVSVSANGGRTYRDLGFLNPGGNPANFLEGDPVVFCSSATQFYYSSILETAVTDSQGNLEPITAISLSSSSNGGVRWGNPVSAIGKDAFSHFLDKPWSSYDPANPQLIYVTYTDFDFTFASAACPNDMRTAIELVSSADGGSTWSAPTGIDQVCGPFQGVQGSNVVVAPDGSVNVAYEFFPATGNNEIHIARSANHGSTFGPIVRVATDVVPNGSNGSLQGLFRSNEFPQLAVDRSHGSSGGALYIVWSDGRDNIIPDVATGSYAYPDVVITKSTDGGLTFSKPQAVSPTPANFAGIGRDQFFPSVAVDKDGHVGVCYYDRRADTANTVVDRYCSVSVDGGRSWLEQRVSASNWLPIHDADNLLGASYMGDYDALTSDALGGNGGFLGAFEIENQGNPDVYANRF